MKDFVCLVFGAFGAAIAALFGGWNAAMTTLLTLMAIDYLSGLVCAGVFHKSQKSPNGALESKACFKGLVRKCMILVLVLVAYRLDLAMGTTYVKDAVCIAFTASESISIVENAGLMGVPVPQVIINAIDVLKHTSKRKDDNNG